MSVSTHRWAFALLLASAMVGSAQEHWVATWAASPLETRPLLPPGPPPQATPGQAAPPQPAPPPLITNFHDQTVRMIVRTSIGGRRARVELSNAFGTKPLQIGAAHVALREKDSAIVTGSDRALTFSGKPSATIPPGAQMLSDAVDLNVPQLGDLVISLYLPADTGAPTMHATGLHTTYIAGPGDLTAAAAIPNPTTTRAAWYFISGVHVAAPPETGLIVAFGDSITDGATSTVDADKSWPSLFARRVLANRATANFAVVNEGISGNRVLRDQAGANALARLDRDVFSQPGVKWMTLLLGINDIGRATGRAFGPQDPDPVTAEEVIAGLRQIIERAHLHGIRILGGTLTPYEGAAYYSEEGEAMRQTVNRWIRSSGSFDAIVDFDAVVHDSANPKQIRPDFNIRDHLHPNDAGYQAMADAIDLAIFSGDKPAAASAAAR